MTADELFRDHKLHTSYYKVLGMRLKWVDDLTVEARIDLEQLRKHYGRVLQLYEAARHLLTSDQRYILEEHYLDRKSLSRLTEEKGSPFYQMAKSTVWRNKQDMLSLVDDFIKSVPA